VRSIGAGLAAESVKIYLTHQPGHGMISSRPSMIRMDELSQVIFPGNVPPESRSLAMIVAYFDESWNGEQSVVFAAGGLLGRLAVWLDLETKWRALLNEYAI
jgi:hypothetical protein